MVKSRADALRPQRRPPGRAAGPLPARVQVAPAVVPGSLAAVTVWGADALGAPLALAALLLAVAAAAALLWRVRGYRRMQTALCESEEQFRCLFRNASDAIFLLDENGFFECNEAALRIFRVADYEGLLHLHPADISPTKQADGSDSRALSMEKIATALRDGSHRFEWIHKRADGTLFPAEVSLSAVHIEARRVLQAVVRDVTHRKESEQQLRSNEEKLRTISEAALDAVIMMDDQGKAVHWNPAAKKMFGYSAEEMLGEKIHQLLVPERKRQAAYAALPRFFETGQGQAVGRTLELQAVRKGGEEFPVEISLAPIRIDDVWCAVAVVRDITERKLADQKLRDEQRTLRRLLKAHDQERKLIAYEIHDGLAQKLVAAIMQCQAVTNSGAETELVSQLLSLLRECVSETRRLISGLRPPVLDEFGVVTAIEGLIAETETSGERDIEFQHDIQRDRLEPVLENSIYRMVQESLRNACRHSQSPRILIKLVQIEDRIQIRVQDWGLGFDPRSVDQSRYGLAGIRERARLLGGDVSINSRLGEGTTIDIELPTDVKDLPD